MESQLTILIGNLNNSDHCADMLFVLNQYLLDPMGLGAPLSKELGQQVLAGLANQQNHLFFLAYFENQCVALANCFVNFSTFRARKLLNIHDFIVVPGVRKQGIGDRLLKYILAYSEEQGYCRVNLEVRSDNSEAMRLYSRNGFTDCNPPMLFLEHRF